MPPPRNPHGELEARVRAFLAAHPAVPTGDGGDVSQILAETGLMNCHSATSIVGCFDKLGKGLPDVTWVTGVRYHDDGNIRPDRSAH